MKRTTLLLTIPLLFTSLAAKAATIDFEELNTADYPIANGGFSSQDVGFLLNYNATYASWDGIALSNAGWKNTAISDYTDQFFLAGDGPTVAVTAGNYAVVYDPGSYGTSPEIDLPDDLTSPQSFQVTNTTYTWATIINGDTYGISKPFSTGSWYMLTATGYDAEGVKTASTDFYLADYRDSDETKHYALTDFTTVDLTPLGDNVKTIKFTMSSSDSGAYGLNTPAYFAFDNLVIDGTRLWETANIRATTWYGDVYTYQTGSGWIYSYDNAAAQYITGTKDNAWVYDEQLGWYWTSAADYSFIYIKILNTWAYFYQDAPAKASDRVYYIYNSAFDGSLPNYPYATAGQISGWLR